MTERGDRAVGRDEQRKHVEALDPVVTNEVRLGTGGCAHGVRPDGVGPRSSIDPRLAVGSERRLVPEQPWLGPRRDDPVARAPHVHHAIALDAVAAHICALERFAPHRLDRVSPKLRDVHAMHSNVGDRERGRMSCGSCDALRVTFGLEAENLRCTAAAARGRILARVLLREVVMSTHEPHDTHESQRHVPVEPIHRVGTTLLFENDRVRVWELVLRPGEQSDLHEHACDYVFVHLTKSRIALLQPGQDPETSEEPAGFVQYTDVGSGIVHAIKNVGDTEHREILVEIKGPSRRSSPQEPQTNEACLHSDEKP